MKTAIFALISLYAIGLPPTRAAEPEFNFVEVGPRSRTGYLGVGIAEVDAERARQLKLTEERGVYVTRVEDDSPAAKAGVQQGDVLLSFGNEQLEGTEQLGRLVRETPPGRNVRVTLWRSGRSQTVTVAMTARPASRVDLGDRSFHFDMPEMPTIVIPDIPSPSLGWHNSILGIDMEGISSQLAEYFGVKQGVLVRSVRKDSAADKAGLHAGDVLTKVGNNAVVNPRDISASLRNLERGAAKSVQVAYVRRGKEMTASVPLNFESGRFYPPPESRFVTDRERVR